MPMLDNASIERIRRSVQITEQRFEDSTTPEDTTGNEQELAWFVLQECLTADNNYAANAAPCIWDATANDGNGEMSDDEDANNVQTIVDASRVSGATVGDRVLCRPLGTQNGMVWEILGCTPRDHYGITDTTLTANGNCTVSIWSHTAGANGANGTWSDTGDNQEDVYDSFWYRGLTLPSGVNVTISYTPENSRWEIVEVPWLQGTIAESVSAGDTTTFTPTSSGVSGTLTVTMPEEASTDAPASTVRIAWDTQLKRWEIRMAKCEQTS